MTLLADPGLAALVDVFKGLVFVIFVLISLLLMMVILIQEGKGGGLGAAFGGAAADAFGVKAGTVNRFTAYLMGGFLGLALLYAGLSAGGGKVSVAPIGGPGGVTVPSEPITIPDILPRPAKARGPPRRRLRAPSRPQERRRRLRRRPRVAALFPPTAPPPPPDSARPPPSASRRDASARRRGPAPRGTAPRSGRRDAAPRVRPRAGSR